MKLSNLVNTTGRQRFLAILITLLMAFSVAACGDDDDNSGSNNNGGADAGRTDTGGNNNPDAGDDGDTGNNGDNNDAGNNGDNNDAGNPDPELNCGEILACQGNCAQGDQTCAQACVSEGSTQGGLQFNALSQCANANCADAANQEALSTCLDTNCSDEIAACDGLNGGGSAEGAACVTDCTSNEDCSGGLSCEQYAQDGSKGCLMVQGGQLGIPNTSTDCSEGASACGAGESCLPYGGGGDNGGEDSDGVCLVPCTEGGNECEGDTTCVDVTGQGHMQCMAQSGGGIAFPADAPTCNQATPCPEGYTTDICFIPG